VNKEQKAAAVQEIAERLGEADAIFAVDYRGISVPEAAELRSRLREADATFRVVKNRLAKRAAEQAGTTALEDLLDGPIALTFVKGDAVVAAKAIATFGRQHAVLEYRGGLMDGEVL
jgi:large subunit ribosomal protein L10